ncbi:hypothetical protein ACVK00_005570 [Burkholderia sp. PvR073]|uniref:arginase family protein n=1 Tax=Burkholderia ambifaria TaxID=152480 RepID=UPI003394304D
MQVRVGARIRRVAECHSSGRRDQPLLTCWPDLDGPLVDDRDACQVGERDAETAEFEAAYGDIVHTAITRTTIQQLLARGPAAVAGELVDWLHRRALRRGWLHVDLDVLDQSQLPAVDSPGSPGLEFDGLDALLGPLVASAASTNNANFAAKMLGYDRKTFGQMLHVLKPANGLGPADNLIFHDSGDVEFKGVILDNIHDYAP